MKHKYTNHANYADREESDCLFCYYGDPAVGPLCKSCFGHLDTGFAKWFVRMDPERIPFRHRAGDPELAELRERLRREYLEGRE